MYPMITENDTLKLIETYFTMPDGVKLYTRIAAPKGQEKWPIVFIRSPYEGPLNGRAYDIAQYDHDRFIRNGYAVVLQHCRGCGDSEGECIPYQEREDGLNSLAMIRTLDIYSGEIFLFGSSYLSTAHLSYLDTNPGDIKGAVLNVQTDRMYFRNYRHGCCYNYCNLGWWLGMIKRAYPNQNRSGTIQRPYKDIMKRILGTDYPPYTDLLINHQNNEFWQRDPRTHVMDQLKIPVLLTEGWYDFYVDGMFDMWERLPLDTKKRSVFMVGPWGHATSVSETAQYPLKNGNLPENYDVEWFNSLRSGKPYLYAPLGQVCYYAIGTDSWRTSPYPTTPSGRKRFYLGEGHTLTPSTCESEAGISYAYDPENRLTCFPYHDIYRAADMGSVEGVLSFQSQAFSEDSHFLGKIRWNMNVSSNCDDTAFFMRVYFVENDVAYNLTETITSLSHIKDTYQAGETATIDLFTPPIAFTIKKGGRIRIDLASDGGVYVPHANVKGHWAEVTETKTATNTIFLKDSFIELDMV